MENENTEYTLSLIAFDLKPGLQGAESSEQNRQLPFKSLKDAFDELQKYENRAFDRELAIEAGLEIFIERAAILENRSSILLAKRNLDAASQNFLRPGVYIEFNSKKISMADFQEATGQKLPPIAKKGLILDYILVQTTAELRKPQRKRMNSGRKSRKGPDSLDNTKDLSL